MRKEKLAYLKVHDRKKAIAQLESMANAYSSLDPDFAGQCRLILSQLQ